MSLRFPRQENWSQLPFPPSGGLPNPGIEPVSLASPALQEDSLALSFGDLFSCGMQSLVVACGIQFSGQGSNPWSVES